MCAGQFRDAGQQDPAFQLGAGEVDVQEQAATFERLGQLAGGVGGQHDERRPLGGDGAQLGDGHREVGQHLQQQTLDFDVGLVGLVDQQHGGLGAPDRGQQRPRQQEFLGEHVGLGLIPVVGAGLDTQDLLGVVPLVERAGLVDALVALQADQSGSGGLRDGAGQFGLADSGRAFHQQRLAEPVGEENRGRGGGVGQVAGFGQPPADVVDVGEQRHGPRGHTHFCVLLKLSSGRADLAVSPDDPLGRGQFRQAPSGRGHAVSGWRCRSRRRTRTAHRR